MSSSFYGAFDMDPFQQVLAVNSNQSSQSPHSIGDNTNLAPSITAFHHQYQYPQQQHPNPSYEFTDPAIISQLTDMENDVKFSSIQSAQSAAMDPTTAFLASAPPQPPPPSSTPASILATPSSSSLANPPPIMAPMNFFETKPSPPVLVAPSPPSTHASGYSPPIAGPSPPSASAVPKPSFVDTSVIPSIGSPLSPAMATQSHAPSVASSASPGSQAVTATGVPLGGVIATRNGSQVTVGAVVASVLDNVVQMASQARDAYLAGKQDQTHAQIEELLESLKLVGGLGVGPSIGTISSNMPFSDGQDETMMPASTGIEAPPPMPTHRSSSSPNHARSSTSANHSPSSSVSPPQRMSLPLGDVLTSPPTTLPTSSLAAALGPLPPFDDGPSSMPMGQPPLLSGSFDSHRKRTASSAPTLVDDLDGPAKIKKRESGILEGIEDLAGPPQPAPMLHHSHTYPAAIPQSQVPVGIPFPSAAATSANVVIGSPASLAAAVQQQAAVAAAASQIAQNPISPSGFPGAPPSSAAVSSFAGWTPTDSPIPGASPTPGGVVIPPPHLPNTAAMISRKFSSEALRGAVLNPSGASSSSFAPALYPSGLPEGLVQSLPGGMVGIVGGSMMDVDPTAVAAVPGSRPGTSHGRPSSSMGDVQMQSASSQPNALQQQHAHQHMSSSQEDFEDESDDDGDSDDETPGRRSAASSVNGSVNGSTGTVKRGGAGKGKRRNGGGSGGESGGAGPANAMSPEVKAVVDRVFVEYLNKVCSNLDATDSKGEAIHQTLMAKKMARLDESPDFRPFKFRIQAFTNGFVEELARQGYGEEQIPVKKIKAYLWHHNPYIARFNEDGKKAKSKGNHIWNIEAKKICAPPNGDPNAHRWVFKQFVRKIAGAPPSMAYIGLKWQWEPKIWDPQLSRASIDVEFVSPNMPAWMRWESGVLVGVPTPESTSLDLVVEARYMQDGQQKALSVTYPITVAPLAVGDSSYPKARRPSLLGADAVNARRFVSDSVVPQATAPRPPLVPVAALPPPVPNAAETAQVIAVISNAAGRVADAARAQGYPTGPAQVQAQAALAKQQHVLSVAAQVISNEAHDALIHRTNGEQPKAGSLLVQAAQAVVHQAARQVQADKTAVAMFQAKSSPVAPITPAPVSLTDVSIATQSAVAHAVAVAGSGSSEVEIMLTANSLIQQRSRADSRAMLSTAAAAAAGGGPVAASVVPGTNPYPHLVNTPQYLR